MTTTIEHEPSSIAWISRRRLTFTSTAIAALVTASRVSDLLWIRTKGNTTGIRWLTVSASLVSYDDPP